MNKETKEQRNRETSALARTKKHRNIETKKPFLCFSVSLFLGSRHGRGGFTLIETLFYTLIISVVLVSAVFFSLDILDGQQKARSYQEVQQNARFGMERLAQEIKAANDVNATASMFSTHPGYLSLSHEVSSKNPTIFTVSGEKLVIKQGASATSTLTSDNVRVTNLVFTDLTVANRTKNIRVSMRVEHVNPDNVTVFTASTTMETSVTIRDQEDLP